MPKVLQLSQLIIELKTLKAPAQESIDFFYPSDVSFKDYQHIKQIADDFLDIIATAFNTKQHFFLNLLISLLPIKAVFNLLELALDFADMSQKNYIYFFEHPRFYSHELGWSEVSIEGIENKMLYVACYREVELIVHKSES